ncbi:MAG: hypothetical protein AMJ81_08585 [Phycisphaerae bacterium SM23_33]|jgi:hypothetical protein|nr:MAG: hypothetical protein AMJ81_08585 [Phycisphaerae bacterium SM23_33]
MDDIQPMTVTYQNTDAELLDLYMHALEAGAKAHGGAVRGVLPLHLFAVLAALAVGHVQWVLAAIFFVILEAAMLLRWGLLGRRGWAGGVRRYAERARKEAWYNNWLCPTTLSLSREGVAYRKWYSACSYHWQIVETVAIWRQYVVITLGSAVLAMIPRRTFASDAEMQQFAGAAQDMMQRAKAEQPSAPAAQPSPAAPEKNTVDDKAD